MITLMMRHRWMSPNTFKEKGSISISVLIAMVVYAFFYASSYQ